MPASAGAPRRFSIRGVDSTAFVDHLGFFWDFVRRFTEDCYRVISITKQERNVTQDARGTAKGMRMTDKFERRVRGQIQGQMLRLSEHRSVAIYLRDGVMWVADFVDGHGELVNANTWFRFNCGALANSHARRRMALESAMPISLELGERIEALHGAAASGGRRSPMRAAKAFIAGLGRTRLKALAGDLIRRRKSREELSAQ
jgi:hypothetical protein